MKLISSEPCKVIIFCIFLGNNHPSLMNARQAPGSAICTVKASVFLKRNDLRFKINKTELNQLCEPFHSISLTLKVELFSDPQGAQTSILIFCW